MVSFFGKVKDVFTSIVGIEADDPITTKSPIKKETLTIQTNADPDDVEIKKKLKVVYRQPKVNWSPYEVALLIFVLEKIKEGKIDRKSAAKKLSTKLRKFAEDKGLMIDSLYRNVPGVTLQMCKMEFLLTNGNVGLSGAGKNFQEMYEIYKRNLDEFNSILGQKASGIFIAAQVDDVKPHETEKTKDWTNFDDIVKSFLPSAPSEIQTDVLHENNIEAEKLSNETNKVTDKYVNNSLCDVTKKRIVAYELNKDFEEVTSWSSLYTSIFNKVIKKYTPKKTFPETIVVAPQKGVKKGRYTRLNNGLFLNVNYSAVQTVQRIKELLFCFEIDCSACILYLGKDGSPIEKLNLATIDDHSTSDRTDKQQVKEKSNKAQSLGEYSEKIKKVLFEKYQKGFRFDSQLDMERLKIFYAQINNESFPQELSVDKIKDIIQNLGIIYGDKVYLPEIMLDDDIKVQVLKYISDCFSNGKNILYYQSIFDKFSDAFLNQNIFSVDILKEYLSYINDNSYFISKDYLSSDRNVIVDVTSEIHSVLGDYVGPFLQDDLFKKLPHLTQSKIIQELRLSRDFISNGKEQYFLIDQFAIRDEELNKIKLLISAMLESGPTPFITAGEMMEVVKKKVPSVFENNESLSDLGIRNAIAYFLKDEFSFNANVISSKEEALNLRTVFKNFALSKEKFSLNELKNLAGSFNSPIYFDVISQYTIRVDKDRFVANDTMVFDTKAVDDAISLFFSKNNYVSIQSINTFTSFPDMSMPWNVFLLESYLAKFSHKFILMNTGFCETKTVGAVVKKGSVFESFEDVLVDVLANSKCLLNKDAALQYLCDTGYLARRTFGSINVVLEKAQMQRRMKG